MNKKLCLEMALCLVAGVFVGIYLAFLYHVNPYLAGTTGGLAGAFCYRPSEVVLLLWEVVCAGCKFLGIYGRVIGELMLIVAIVGASVAFHYSLAVFMEHHLPGAWGSTWQTVMILYFVGIVFGVAFRTVVFDESRKVESVSWSMPIMSRFFAFQLKRGLNKFPGSNLVRICVYALSVIFCLPVSVFFFTWLCFFGAIDLLLTIAMLLFFTPRLAIAIGAFTGTLTACCFCQELWGALLFGWFVGAPVGIGFHWLRLYLSSAEDRKAWSAVTA